MKYSAEELSRAGDKYLGRSYSEMDCQEFVERCLADIGCRLDLKGSNAWYRKVREEGWTGSPEECVRTFGSVPAGAFLFIHAFDGREVGRGYRDGLGNASHIGIRTGRGKGAIHSSAGRGCVAESEFHDRTVRNGGWNMVGLWNRMDYGKTVSWVLEHSCNSEFTIQNDFLLWHYSNIMILFKEQNDPRGDKMAKTLMSHPRFLEDLANEDKKNHPWHLVLWNCGKYARMIDNLSVYKRMHRRAMEIACSNRDNVTMMTFAISISADRLSWCRKSEAKDTSNAEIEFMNTIKQIKHAGTTEEMDRHFMIDPKNLPAMLKSNLDYLKNAYLR